MIRARARGGLPREVARVARATQWLVIRSAPVDWPMDPRWWPDVLLVRDGVLLGVAVRSDDHIVSGGEDVAFMQLARAGVRVVVLRPAGWTGFVELLESGGPR